MTQPAKSQEPSMEEILASIRRIIADDDASKSAQRTAEAAKPTSEIAAPPPRALSAASPVASPEPDAAEIHAAAPLADSTSTAANPQDQSSDIPEDQSSDILDLTESITAAVSNPPASVFAPSAMTDLAPQFHKIDGHSGVGFNEPVERRATQTAVEARRQDDDARGQLLSRETSAAVDSAFNALAQTVLVQNARTLEDLVREMLRPMLKTWLDDNLPGMVERLVRSEIERVSRGR